MYKHFEFWKSCNDINALVASVKEHEYPPRFRIQCIQKKENADADLDFCFKVFKRGKDQDAESIGIFSLDKNATGIQATNIHSYENRTSHETTNYSYTDHIIIHLSHIFILSYIIASYICI